MNDIQLKPCPFCGGEAEFVDYGVDGEYEDWDLECKQCHALFIFPGAEDGAVVTKKEAVEAWNRRSGT